MNQEQNNSVNPTVKDANNSSNINTTSNNDKMLAGSPGIMIAPVTTGAVDASSVDKGQVNGSVLSTGVTSSQTQKVSEVVVNPTVVAPRVAVNSLDVNSGSLPPVVEQPVVDTTSLPPKKSKKGKIFTFFLLLIVIGMGAYIYMDYKSDLARGECSLLVATDNSLRNLEVSSSIVQELYSKVKTTVREDLAHDKYDDAFKLYLAFRQIPNSEIYESNCNLFNDNAMSNFTCSSATNFIPTAFSEETIQKEVKKLFGEGVSIPNQNIFLGNSCFGGYQYIADRGEYVKGYCGNIPTTTYRADKELISASVEGDTITLKEKVRYYSAQTSVPDSLKSGVYVYTFKLDNNYHYAYIGRSIEDNS